MIVASEHMKAKKNQLSSRKQFQTKEYNAFEVSFVPVLHALEIKSY